MRPPAPAPAMRRFIARHIRYRRARAGVLGAAILLASVSFVLLVSAAKTSDIRVRGSVESNFRNAYDILVRPQGSFTRLEQREELVRDNYLSGIYGGISLAQYNAIRRIPGVDIAAPIANVGYVLATGRIFLSVRPWLDEQPVQLFRVRLASRAHAGASVYPGDTGYVYYTRRAPFEPVQREVVPGGEPLEVCAHFGGYRLEAASPFAPSEYLRCYSSRSPGSGSDVIPEIAPRGGVGIEANVSFPILVSAIDPVQEARLVGLEEAIVAGRYLRPGDGPYVKGVRWVPVIASARTFLDETLGAYVDRLAVADPAQVPRELASERAYRFVTGRPATLLATISVPADRIYERMLGRQFSALAYWRPSETRYRYREGTTGIELTPIPTTNPPSIWRTPYNPTGFLPAPAANQDTQFRELRQFVGSAQSWWWSFDVT